MTIAISGQVPAEAQNGMKGLEDAWTSERTPDPIYAVVKVERDGIKFKDADQVWSATMKFTHIEPLTGDLALQGKGLLEAACAARGGDVSTELDMPTDEDGDKGWDPAEPWSGVPDSVASGEEPELSAPEPDLEEPTRHLSAVDQ